MAEFTPINTQEELNAAIGPRLQRERETVAKEYTGKISEYEKTITDLQKQVREAGEKQAASDKQLTELSARIKGYESDSVKTRIALEAGLPWGMAARLAGDTEEAIRKDAEALKGLMKSQTPVAPLAKETVPEDANKAALMALAKKLGTQ